jgi:hypothetical protein
MTARQSARAYLDAYRARCVERDIDPATGNQRVFAWPPERQTEPGRPWWADGSLWDEPGAAHSSTERDALASIAAQARAAAPPRLTTLEAMTLVREVMVEMAAERITQMVLPLRELHARRGVEVITLEGVRLEVRKKTA